MKILGNEVEACLLFLMFLQMVQQVLQVKQAAQLLVHCDPVLEYLMKSIARKRGFPDREEVLAGASEATIGNDWRHFQQYTDQVNPHVSQLIDYVPIRKDRSRPSVKSMQLLLY